jgi:hypothetical protein
MAMTVPTPPPTAITVAGGTTSQAAPAAANATPLAHHHAGVGQAKGLSSTIVWHPLDEGGVRGDLEDRERAQHAQDYQRFRPALRIWHTNFVVSPADSAWVASSVSAGSGCPAAVRAGPVTASCRSP